MSDEIMTNNPKLKPQSEVNKCPNCGAPLLSEVCEYCGVYIGEVSSIELASEFPVVECKQAKFTFWNLPFLLCFALPFTICPIPTVLFGSAGTMFEDVGIMAWLLLPIGIGFDIAILRTILMVFSNRLFGKKLKGTVYGYMDDTVAYNGVNGQKIKVLVNTREGKKFVIFPLEKTNKPYPVNSEIDLSLYKNTAAVVRKKMKKEDYNW